MILKAPADYLVVPEPPGAASLPCDCVRRIFQVLKDDDWPIRKSLVSTQTNCLFGCILLSINPSLFQPNFSSAFRFCMASLLRP